MFDVRQTKYCKVHSTHNIDIHTEEKTEKTWIDSVLSDARFNAKSYFFFAYFIYFRANESIHPNWHKNDGNWLATQAKAIQQRKKKHEINQKIEKHSTSVVGRCSICTLNTYYHTIISPNSIEMRPLLFRMHPTLSFQKATSFISTNNTSNNKQKII